VKRAFRRKAKEQKTFFAFAISSVRTFALSKLKVIQFYNLMEHKTNQSIPSLLLYLLFGKPRKCKKKAAFKEKLTSCDIS
jgi:hypothetical protein